MPQDEIFDPAAVQARHLVRSGFVDYLLDQVKLYERMWQPDFTFADAVGHPTQEELDRISATEWINVTAGMFDASGVLPGAKWAAQTAMEIMLRSGVLAAMQEK